MSVVILNPPAVQVIQSDLADAVSRGRDVDYAGEVSTFPRILQGVQQEPSQQEVTQVVHAKVLLEPILSPALGDQHDTRWTHTDMHTDLKIDRSTHFLPFPTFLIQ